MPLVWQIWKLVNLNTNSSEKQLITPFFTEILPAIPVFFEAGSTKIVQQ